jgi:hypothetical protein
MNCHTGKTGWMWFDDYARTILFPKAKDEARKYVPPTTPRPELHKL